MADSGSQGDGSDQPQYPREYSIAPASVRLNISEDIFDKIGDETQFSLIILRELDEIAHDAAIEPQYSIDLLHDAYQSYDWDIERLKGSMPKSDPPDHFKRSGYLAYWLRRNSPILDWKEDKEEHRLGESERAFRQFIFNYGRVYLPFMLGYRLCYFFEENKQGDHPSRQRIPIIDGDHMTTTCHFLKYKEVSPHALGLIYRSLFFV